MSPFKIKPAVGPEALIQAAIIKELKSQDWYVKVLFGNLYQSGVPDLFAANSKYGQRFIEVKNPDSFSFTPAQCAEFPKMIASGVGIWILFDSAPEELMKLFKPANGAIILYNYFHGIRTMPGYKKC